MMLIAYSTVTIGGFVMEYLTQIHQSGLMVPFALLITVIILGIGFIFKSGCDDEEWFFGLCKG